MCLSIEDFNLIRKCWSEPILSVTLHVGTRDLIYRANQMAGFYD